MGPIVPGGEVALGQSPIKARPCPLASGQCSGQDADGAEGVGGAGEGSGGLRAVPRGLGRCSAPR